MDSAGDREAVEPDEGTGTENKNKEEEKMKQHKFFAWATVFCFVMTMLTGYKRK